MTVETLRRVCDEGCCMSVHDTTLNQWDYARERGNTTTNYVRPMFEVLREHEDECEVDEVLHVQYCWSARPHRYIAGDEEHIRNTYGEEPVYL